jgi:hypothetical protein
MDADQKRMPVESSSRCQISSAETSLFEVGPKEPQRPMQPRMITKP